MLLFNLLPPLRVPAARHIPTRCSAAQPVHPSPDDLLFFHPVPLPPPDVVGYGRPKFVPTLGATAAAESSVLSASLRLLLPFLSLCGRQVLPLLLPPWGRRPWG